MLEREAKSHKTISEKMSAVLCIMTSLQQGRFVLCQPFWSDASTIAILFELQGEI